MPEKKKKRASLSSFTIILSILVGLAIVTVIMGAMGVEGVQGATLSDVLTAPVKGFQGAMGVCIFVMVLGGFRASSPRRAHLTPALPPSCTSSRATS